MSCRILIADDHRLVRKALRIILENRSDWEVCAEACDGLEAVQKAAELKPDVVILDLVMPGMNGLQAAHEISAAAPRTPILLHTAHAVSVPPLVAAKNGVRQIVSKGGSAEQLLTAIDAVVDEQRLETTPPLPPQRGPFSRH